MNQSPHHSQTRPFWIAGLTFVLLTTALFATGCGSTYHMMPTPASFANAVMSPFSAISPELQSNKVSVLYATDRNPTSGEGGVLRYGYNRSQSLAFGSCTVEIGREVGWQALVNLNTTLRESLTLPLTIKAIEEIGRFPATPYSMIDVSGKFEVEPQVLDRDACLRQTFQKELSHRLALTPRKEVFLFIHGYNNSFEDAVFTAGEFWHFLGREGVPVAYSWPAGIGGLRGYTYDRESGEFTNFHLKEFVRMLAANPDLQKIHIVAHSRGTDVCTTALRELFGEARAQGKTAQSVFKIGNLVLAAPDIAMSVMTQRIGSERLQLGVDQATIYVSPYDRAMKLSNWFFGGLKRLGGVGVADLSEQQKENLKRFKGVSFINVTSRSGFLGHGYFYSNPSVSADLILLLREGRAPGEENGRPLYPVAPGFWELYQGYPDIKQRPK